MSLPFSLLHWIVHPLQASECMFEDILDRRASSPPLEYGRSTYSETGEMVRGEIQGGGDEKGEIGESGRRESLSGSGRGKMRNDSSEKERLENEEKIEMSSTVLFKQNEKENELLKKQISDIDDIVDDKKQEKNIVISA